MKIQQFLQHHGIASNPFADEDAQTDLVFKGYCIANTYHPAWDKIYGDPTEPATSVVFGEKGSGKTALRLQIAHRLTDYNADHPERQVFVVQYDDFNPFLDRFRDRFSGRGRRIERMLTHWRLWDHIDAILALAVTQVVDRVLEVTQARHPAARDEPLARPVAGPLAGPRPDAAGRLLRSIDGRDAGQERWDRLRKKLRFSTWRSKWDLALGIAVDGGERGRVRDALVQVALVRPGLLLAGAGVALPPAGHRGSGGCCGGSGGRGAIARNTRVLNRNVNLLRRMLMSFSGGAIGRPAAARLAADRRPLRAAGQAPGGAPLAASGRHRRAWWIGWTSRTSSTARPS